MTATIDALTVRRVMGRRDWTAPEVFGPDGWRLLARDGSGSLIVSASPYPDGNTWVHASIARVDHLPSYDDLCRLRTAVWGQTGWAYQVFAPPSAHVNIHAFALHLWGLADGRPVLPNFGSEGTI